MTQQPTSSSSLPPNPSPFPTSVETLSPLMYNAILDFTKTQAVQGEKLDNIQGQLTSYAQTMAQQSVQIQKLVSDVSSIKTEQSTWKADMSLWRNDVSTWISNAPSSFVPRKEHEAANHEDRIKALEDAQNAANTRIAASKGEFMEWVNQHAIQLASLSVALIGLAITIALFLMHH